LTELVFEVFSGLIGGLGKLRGCFKGNSGYVKFRLELGVLVEEMGDFKGKGFVFLGKEVDFFLESI